jgi:aminoglycoside phosphotransferase (APT) family kinase protein
LAGLLESNVVCHGDCHPDNVFTSSRGPTVIDWMTATHCNPVADVARTVLLFRSEGYYQFLVLLRDTEPMTVQRSNVSTFKRWLDRLLVHLDTCEFSFVVTYNAVDYALPCEVSVRSNMELSL